MKLSPSRSLLLALVAVIIIVGWTYINYRLAIVSPGGIDFLTHWVGTRALFQGESPYSRDVAVRVQTAYYGRPAVIGENEFLDVYPLYAELIFAPFAAIPNYELARAAWMTFLGLSTMALFLIPLRIVGWKPRITTFVLYMLYAVFGYHSVRPIFNGNVSTVIALIIVCAVWATQAKKDALAGLLTALSLAKPNLAILPALFLIVWLASLGRWRFIFWFAGGFLALVLAGLLIIPNWPAQNLANVLRYNGYNPPTTIAAALEFFLPAFGHWIGIAAYVAIIIALIVQWRSVLGAGFHAFLPAFSFTLIASQWLWVSTDPGNFITLALPLALILKNIEERASGTIWANLSLGVLLIGLWALFLATMDRSQGNLQSPIMFFPLPAVLLGGLYACRKAYQ
ncbi:MAG TPA: glycosyltransferase family 87 protein [Anaerolineales bacterium]